jgi:hypothetical protein
MWEPPSAFVTFCGNRLTSFFGGFASPICRLRMADGGSDQGFGTRGPSWDGWRGLRSGLWHSWAVLGWLAGVQIGLLQSFAVLRRQMQAERCCDGVRAAARTLPRFALHSPARQTREVLNEEPVIPQLVGVRQRRWPLRGGPATRRVPAVVDPCVSGIRLRGPESGG